MDPSSAQPLEQTGTESAHASLHILGDLTYDDIKRHFDEEHARVWDLVRRCYAAEQAEPPIIDVHRLAVKIGKHWFVALAPEIVEQGWLQYHPLEAQRLLAQLPNDPVAIAESTQGPLTLKSAAVVSRAAKAPTVADLLRRMRDEHIGRPSTYASHIESVSEMKKRGYVQEDDEGRLSLTARGSHVLQTLRERAFTGIGIAHCKELDRDLDAIEVGEATPYDIAVKHLSLVMDVTEASKRTRKMANRSISQSAHASDWKVLPKGLDPEHALPRDHRLRQARRAIEEITQSTPSAGSNTDHSAHRAATVSASAFLWNLNSDTQILEELQFNLAYRWLCDIGPEDVLWPAKMFRRMVEEQHDLRQSIEGALKEALAVMAFERS
jgi:hypothetical protein